MPAGHVCQPGEPMYEVVQCATTGECEGVEEELARFKHMYAYLLTISEVAQVEPFSDDVVRVYWLGGELLNRFQPGHFSLLVDQMRAQGISPAILNAVEHSQPKFFLPFHFYKVMFEEGAFGQELGETSLAKVNACMVRWGEVTELDGEEAVLTLNGIEKTENGLVIGQKETRMPMDQAYVQGLKIGDTVSVHLGLANKILTAEETQSVAFWTQEVLNRLKS